MDFLISLLFRGIAELIWPTKKDENKRCGNDIFIPFDSPHHHGNHDDQGGHDSHSDPYFPDIDNEY